MRILWVTNDLPPGSGGIERFVGELAKRVFPTTSLVLGPRARNSQSYDREQPYVTARWNGPVVPTRNLLARVIELVDSHDADVVVLGAAWPLGRIARAVRNATGRPVIGLTHGLEAGLAQAGVGKALKWGIGQLDALTTISKWTEQRIVPWTSGALHRLSPGVDLAHHAFSADARVRQRTNWSIPSDAQVVGCVSRMVRRKGQDRLLDLWPEVRRTHDAWLVFVGDGPLERRLRKHRAANDSRLQVLFAGAVPWAQLPDCYSAIDVFAMPCRTRFAGLDVEGFGIVYLEAQAAGLPVIVGASGGAPEACNPVNSTQVDGRNRDELLKAIRFWLDDDESRRRAADTGPSFVEGYDWDAVANRFAKILDETVSVLRT